VPVPIAVHPLDPPTTFGAPAPRLHHEPQHEPPREPHRERHPAGEFASPVALSPPEAEPRVTRLVDVINERPAPAEPVQHEQPALVVDDFAWDLDEPEDYSAPV
jgi:hypothetical protein